MNQTRQNLAWAEWQALGKLAAPLIVTQLAQSVLLATDVVFMSWLGQDELAGVMLAGAVFSLLQIFGVGLAAASAPLLAQRYGGGTGDASGSLGSAFFYVIVGYAVAATPVMFVALSALQTSGQDPRIVEISRLYLGFCVWSLAPSLALVVLRSYAALQDRIGMMTLVTVAGIASNVAANYLLIFGHFGLPPLGVAGAGIATALSNLAMAALAFRIVHFRWPLTRIAAPVLAEIFQILRLGIPIGAMMAAEMGLFSAMTVLMGLVSTQALAAHAVALQFVAVTFMVPLGLSQAITLRVGLAVGARSMAGVLVAAATGTMATLAFMLMIALVFLSMPRPLVGLFFPNLTDTSIVHLVVQYLLVASAFQLFDGLQVALAAVLRGAGDTLWPFVAALVGYWLIGIPAGVIAAFLFGMGGVGVWLGTALGFAVVSILLGLRLVGLFRSGVIG